MEEKANDQISGYPGKPLFQEPHAQFRFKRLLHFASKVVTFCVNCYICSGNNKISFKNTLDFCANQGRHDPAKVSQDKRPNSCKIFIFRNIQSSNNSSADCTDKVLVTIATNTCWWTIAKTMEIIIEARWLAISPPKLFSSARDKQTNYKFVLATMPTFTD